MSWPDATVAIVFLLVFGGILRKLVEADCKAPSAPLTKPTAWWESTTTTKRD